VAGRGRPSLVVSRLWSVALSQVVGSGVFEPLGERWRRRRSRFVDHRAADSGLCKGVMFGTQRRRKKDGNGASLLVGEAL
jgi:hypothetical protein